MSETYLGKNHSVNAFLSILTVTLSRRFAGLIWGLLHDNPG